MDIVWSQPIQETGYNPSKSVMVTNYPSAEEQMDTWSKPTQETGYGSSRSAMVMADPAVATH